MSSVMPYHIYYQATSLPLNTALVLVPSPSLPSSPFPSSRFPSPPSPPLVVPPPSLSSLPLQVFGALTLTRCTFYRIGRPGLVRMARHHPHLCCIFQMAVLRSMSLATSDRIAGSRFFTGKGAGRQRSRTDRQTDRWSSEGGRKVHTKAGTAGTNSPVSVSCLSFR